MKEASEPKLAGVIGWPITHSLSPVLHAHWFERYGRAGAYVPLPVPPDRLAAALDGLPALGFAGCNVTLPHKEAVFERVDEHDAAALAMRAVNTVLVLPDGRLRGLNTDGVGFLAHLRAEHPALNLAGQRALLLGTGGAARAIARVLLDAGIDRLGLCNRTRARAEALAVDLDADGRVEIVVWEKRGAALEGLALLVNATSLGMAGKPPLDLALDALPRDAVVDDIVYRPLRTPLLAAARARGNPTVDGLGMLLHQAVPGFAHWGGVMPAVDAATRRAVLTVLDRG